MGESKDIVSRMCGRKYLASGLAAVKVGRRSMVYELVIGLAANQPTVNSRTLRHYQLPTTMGQG